MNREKNDVIAPPLDKPGRKEYLTQGSAARFRSRKRGFGGKTKHVRRPIGMVIVAIHDSHCRIGNEVYFKENSVHIKKKKRSRERIAYPVSRGTERTG